MIRYFAALCSAVFCSFPVAGHPDGDESLSTRVDETLASQVRVEGKLTAWAPRDGASTQLLSTRQTVDTVRFLMGIEKPSLRVEASVLAAVRWLEETAFGGMALETAARESGVAIPHALQPDPKVDSWASFYELATGRPVFPALTEGGVGGFDSYDSSAQDLLMKEYPAWRRRLALESDAPVLYLVGDSTLADKPRSTHPERGWGQMLREFAMPPLRVDNHAMNGRSTKSFIDEGRWDEVVRRLKAGDWVLIQFGHNDSKSQKPEVYAEAQTDYRGNLLRMVNEVRSKGAHPLLASSVARRAWNEAQDRMVPTHGDYPMVAREVAGQEGVPFLEMEALTTELETKEGYEGSIALHLWFEPGEQPTDPNGKQDNTHYSAMGGRKVAQLAISEFHRLDLPFADLFSDSPLDLDKLANR